MITAALGVAICAAVILAAFLGMERRYSSQVHAANQDLRRQLTAATDALLTDLNSLPVTTEDFQ